MEQGRVREYVEIIVRAGPPTKPGPYIPIGICPCFALHSSEAGILGVVVLPFVSLRTVFPVELHAVHGADTTWKTTAAVSFDNSIHFGCSGYTIEESFAVKLQEMDNEHLKVRTN